MVRDQWPRYAEAVRTLCVAAIAKRQSHRLYIRWLESEIRQLPRIFPEKKSDEQLELPFASVLPI